VAAGQVHFQLGQSQNSEIHDSIANRSHKNAAKDEFLCKKPATFYEGIFEDFNEARATHILTTDASFSCFASF